MYIGLDLGTSSLKALAIDDTQKIVAEVSTPLTVQRPHTGWSEQNATDWENAAQTVLGALQERIDMAQVRGIGLSGHMHGATLLDAAHQPLRPCILWNDTRAAPQAAVLDADPKFRTLSGNIVFAGFTAPKLVWVAEHEPEIFARTALVLLPKDYLRLWLTGEAVSEMSDAAGTSWLDTGARDWSDALLSASGMTRAQMPALVEGNAPSGHLRPELARSFGLRDGVVVAGGAGDNAASAVGMGVVTAGDAFVSLGTSGVLFAASEAYQPDAASAVHSFCHALPDMWHQMGVILSATDALNWLAGVTGTRAQDLTEALGELQAPAATTFLPYLGGERTPHNDAAIRASLTGVEHATDRAALTRAVIEGVTHALRDSFDALASTGTQMDRLIAVGGGAQSAYWLSAIATSLDMPIDVPEAGDFGAAFGAARLGLMAATGAGAELATPPAIARQVLPVPALKQAFADAHDRYVATYHALKGLNP